MNATEIQKILDAKVYNEVDEEPDVDFGYSCDLMSDVLAFVTDKTVLITGLTNIHVMRTAEMLDIHCIVYARGKIPSDELLEEANDLDIVVLATAHNCYTTCGLMYEAGIRSKNVRTGA